MATAPNNPNQPATQTQGLMAPTGTGTGTNGSAASPSGNTGNYPIQPASAPTATQATQPTAAQQPTAVQQAQQAQQAAQAFAPTTTQAPPTALTGGATVEGRLNSLLESDSTYMKAARDSALQQMNKRGLMQSSIAVGASQDAAIRNALPIASQDAQAEASQQNNYNLHRYDVARVGVDTGAQSLLSAQNAAQATDKAGQDYQLEQQKAYITLNAAANDRYAQEFSEIQRSEMTAEQKVVATEELKKWKIASDNWLNQTMATFSGSNIDLGPFTGGTTGGTGAPATPTNGTQAGGAYASLASAASQPVEQQIAALRTAGVPQAALDYASTAGWPLFKDGQYLSGWYPPSTIKVGQRVFNYPGKPYYSAVP